MLYTYLLFSLADLKERRVIGRRSAKTKVVISNIIVFSPLSLSYVESITSILESNHVQCLKIVTARTVYNISTADEEVSYRVVINRRLFPSFILEKARVRENTVGEKQRK